MCSLKPLILYNCHNCHRPNYLWLHFERANNLLHLMWYLFIAQCLGKLNQNLATSQTLTPNFELLEPILGWKNKMIFTRVLQKQRPVMVNLWRSWWAWIQDRCIPYSGRSQQGKGGRCWYQQFFLAEYIKPEKTEQAIFKSPLLCAWFIGRH